jgi:hypothetical protein
MLIFCNNAPPILKIEILNPISGYLGRLQTHPVTPNSGILDTGLATNAPFFRVQSDALATASNLLIPNRRVGTAFAE